MTIRTALVCLTLNAALTSQVFAAFLIDPLPEPASSANSTYSPRTLDQAINGNGLSTPTDYPTGAAVPVTWDGHSNDPNTMYLSNGVPTPTMIFDLGAEYSLTGFHLWNYNEVNGTFNQRGIATADIEVSPTGLPGSYTPVATSPAFTIASGLSGDTGATYSLSAFSDRFVMIHALTNFGANGTGDSYTGISEIRFIGGAPTPEPSTFVLCGLGLVGLFIAARRRRKA